MKKIKVGVFGPVGRMGSDVIKQLKNDNDFQIINICEKKVTELLGKKLTDL